MTPRSALLPCLLCALLAPALPAAAAGPARAGSEGTARRPLDLTLPSDVVTEAHSLPPAGNAAQLPDLGEPRAAGAGQPRQAGGRPADLPYGAGYEARQAGAAGQSGGMGPLSGIGQSGGGHGRGGGRGR